jgi:hypothetical protein
MRNRPRADCQGTSGERCSPRLVQRSAGTNPTIPAMTPPSTRAPDGTPLRRLAGQTRTRSARCPGIAVIMGLGLQLLSCVYGVLPAWAQAGQAASEINRPALQIGNAVRYNEDWSVLRGVDLSTTDDFWDRVKFIPLTKDQNVWLTLGGQVRERLEYFNEFEFGSSEPEPSDVYLLSRFRLSVDFHVSRYFRIFAEGKSALSTDRDLLGGNTTSFMDTIDLQNGFADVMIPLGDQASVTLRGGRQEFIFGAQRLVGVSDFSNVRRTFDGGTGIVRVGDWTITPLWAELVVVQKYRFNESSADQKLYGSYSTGPAPLLPVNLDLYWLGVDNAGVTFNGTSGREQRQTLGGRVWRHPRKTGVDFEVEGAFQFGTIGDGDIAAWMITGVLGYTLPAPRLSPRVYVEFDYASGDSRPGGNVGTFNQLYPSTHSFLGYIDYVGRQNIISPNAGLSMTPVRDLTLSLQQYFFWRASDRDAFYNKQGFILRPGTETTARYIGAEIDLLATYNLTYHVQFYAGYSHFFTGEFIRKTGPSKDSDFFYAAIQYTF